MNKKRIDILIPDFSDLGAQRVAINLANGLNNTHIVRFVVFDRNGSFHKYLHTDIPIVSLNETISNIPKLRVLLKIFSYRNTAKKNNTDIAISFSPITNYAVVFAKLGNKKIKTIIQEHAFPSLFLKDRENVSALYEILFKHLLIKIYEKSDCFVTITDAIKKDFIENFNIKSKFFEVVRNPLDIEKINSLAHELVNDFTFDHEKKYLIAIGRLSEQKNFKRLIDIFEKVKKQKSNTELLIIGKGALESELKEHAKKKNLENFVHFLGFKENPYSYVSKSDVFCLSSNWEGLPQVIAEAMVCRTPVVAHDCQSGPAEMIQNKKNGMLTPYGDLDKFAQAVIEILENENLHKLITDNAYNFATQEYSLEKYTAQYKKIIEALLKKERQ